MNSALVAFGLDSAIEVSSAAAVAGQFSARDHATREAREKTALRIIAVSFCSWPGSCSTPPSAGHGPTPSLRW